MNRLTSKICLSGSDSMDGTTLVELVVAAALFALLAAAMAGIFLSAIRSERFAFGFISAQNNVRYALEIIAREARTGRNFQLCTSPASCSANPTAPEGVANRILRFTNQADEDVCYRLSAGRLERGIGCTSFRPLTSNRVNIQQMRFYMRGAILGDNFQPQLTIALSLKSGDVTANVQTTITQREIDL